MVEEQDVYAIGEALQHLAVADPLAALDFGFDAKHLRQLLDALPVAVYTTDAAGLVTYFNQAAADLAGRRPALGTDEWCVTWKLHLPDGTPLAHSECPMAIALTENRSVRGVEAIAERPDGTRVPFMPFPTPLRDENGELVGAVNMLLDISEHKKAERRLRQNEAWLAGQKEAFQAAMNGAPLEKSLGILIETAMKQAESERRCAFYIANPEGTELRHVVGMPDGYVKCVDGLKIGPGSLPCGLAVHRGEPVIMPDVLEEPVWEPWAWLAREFDFRGCWSFPIETASGKVVGSFAMYFKEPNGAADRDRELAAALTHTASIIISRHQESLERERISQALRESERNLAAELAAARHLQSISTSLIREGDVEALYAQIVEAAGEVMHSDMASIQVLDHENDALRLIAHKGFDAEAEATWRWIEHDDATSCGHALKTKTRIVVPDIEADEFMACTPAQEQYRKAGIRAVQSTPLVGRAGHSLGMISTHWRMPHEPSERDLRIFDVLARQAADLIERKESEDALQRRAAQLRLLLDELNHRVKNTLATVQSIAHQTLRHAPTMAEGRKSLDARLIALSRAHNVLTREHWEGANLRELVAEALAAYSNGSGPRRFDVSGNDIRLLPKAGLAISMALHELATNAVKYGALSNENGHVRIRWGGGEDAQLFRLEWSEIDGPPIEQPRRLGFGSRLIKHGLAQDLGGVVKLHFEPDGLVFAIDAPLKELCGGDDKPHPRPLDDRWER